MDYSKKTKDRYDERLAKFGYNPKTLGWLKGRQGIRFSVLTSIGTMNNSNILDVGCGFGDLCGFLKYKKLKFQYLGLELNPNLIEYGKDRYLQANFKIFDIEKNNIIGKYDWVIISGLFNFKRDNPYWFIEFVLRKVFRSCRKGVSVDFMTSYVDFKNRNANYVEPEKIMKICKKITPRMSLRHDYMPFKFCVYLYKNDKKTTNNIFMEYYRSLDKYFRTNKWLKKIN